MTFEELVSRVELMCEQALEHEDKAVTYGGALIFERLHGVMDAIDAFHQGS
jgi:hypothetical protein